jgi:ribosomal protein S18 acetylase RimI-like enzyme
MNLPEGNSRGPKVRLLTAGPAEADEIESMARKIWPAAYAGIISDAQIEFMLHWMYSPSKLIAEMNQEGIFYHWILSEGNKAGFIAAGPSPEDESVHQLYKFYLLPARQNLGIGSSAMNLLIDRLSESGCSRIELRVNRSNTRAIDFYRKNDFEVYAADCRDIGGGFVMDDFLLRRLFPAARDAPKYGKTIR